MPHPYSRNQRVADQMHRELAELMRQASDPRFRDVTITDVDVSPDLKNAQIYFSSHDENQIQETCVALNKASGYFRHHMAEKMNLRVTPKIKFVFDQTLQKAGRIDQLLGKIPTKLDDETE